MSWLALRLLLRRIPGIWYVAAFVVLFLLASGYGLYRHGRTVGEVRVHRIALADSVVHAHEKVDTATHHTDSVAALAAVANRRSVAGRTNRQRIRIAVDSLVKDLPYPVVQLIDADDRQIARDSVTITALDGALKAAMEERKARIEADTVEAHQATLGVVVGHSHKVVYVLAGVALGVAAVLVTR